MSKVLLTLISMLGIFSPVVKVALNSLEDNTVQPELKKLIAACGNEELRTFLIGVDKHLDDLIHAEISKIS